MMHGRGVVEVRVDALDDDYERHGDGEGKWNHNNTTTHQRAARPSSHRNYSKTMNTAAVHVTDTYQQQPTAAAHQLRSRGGPLPVVVKPTIDTVTINNSKGGDTTGNRMSREDLISAFLDEASQVRICFMVDATKSMDASIAAVKDNFRRVFASVKKDFPRAKIKAAVVAYRDFDCGHIHTQALDFTGDASILHDFLARLSVEGGDDFAEDVFSGLERAAQLNWRGNGSGSGSSRLIFHVADAPCHGLQFHNGEVSDKYPDGDPQRRSLKLLLGKLYQECGVKGYFFSHLNDETYTMIDEFQKVSPGSDWLKSTHVGHDTDALTRYLQKSLLSSIHASCVAVSEGPVIGPVCKNTDVHIERMYSSESSEDDDRDYNCPEAVAEKVHSNVSSAVSPASAHRAEAVIKKLNYMNHLVSKCKKAGLGDEAGTLENQERGVFNNFAATIAFALKKGVISAQQADKYRKVNRAGNEANHQF